MPRYEDLDPEFDQPNEQADRIGTFAVEASERLEAASGKLAERQAVNAVKSLVGQLHRLAHDQGIIPPEAAILCLSEDDEQAARDLLEIGLDISDGAKRPLKPETVE